MEIRANNQHPAPLHGLNDMDRVRDAIHRIPALSAAGPMYPIASAAGLPPGLRIVRHVEMNTIAAVVVQHGETLCTSGLATCVMLTARGTNDKHETVIAMLHQSDDLTAADAVAAMRRTMRAMKVLHYTTMVLGGELSRNPAQAGSVVHAIAIAQAAHDEGSLVCARVGVSQPSPEDLMAQEGGAHALPAWHGVPAAPLCAVVAAQGVYFAPEVPHAVTMFTPTLFNEDSVISVGLPLDAILAK